MSISEEVISSLKGKVIKKNDNRFEYGESNEWTPYNAEMNMQSIKVNLPNTNIKVLKSNM